MTAFGNMQPSQQMCSKLALDAARCRRAASSRRAGRCRACRWDRCGRQWRPVLSCEPEPFTVPSFCATWKSIVHGRSARVIFFSASSSAAWSDQSKSSGQDAILRRVVAHREEQRVRHVGLEADGLRAGRPSRAARPCASRCACRPSRSPLRRRAARRSPRRCRRPAGRSRRSSSCCRRDPSPSPPDCAAESMRTTP